MGITIDATEWKTEEDVNKGFVSVPPGRYHVVVQEVDQSMKYGDNVRVELRVLAGTTPDQRNAVHKERLPLAGPALKKTVKFALAAGLMKSSDLGKQLDIDFDAAIGKQLIVELEEGKPYTDRKGRTVTPINVGFDGFHRLDSPMGADVPRGNLSDDEDGGEALPDGWSADPDPTPAPATQGNLGLSGKLPRTKPRADFDELA